MSKSFKDGYFDEEEVFSFKKSKRSSKQNRLKVNNFLKRINVEDLEEDFDFEDAFIEEMGDD